MDVDQRMFKKHRLTDAKNKNGSCSTVQNVLSSISNLNVKDGNYVTLTNRQEF